jgi:uncharacterized protein
MELEFEWDPTKAEANLRSHGISFAEASTAFHDPLSLAISDPDHSGREERYLLLGSSTAGRLVVVAHTVRRDRIRIISARKPTRRERRQYEQGSE